MSVLLEALARANERKDALWNGDEFTFMDDDGVLMLLSGLDLDPGDLHSYLELAASSLLMRWASGVRPDIVIQGAITEGILMGSLIRTVACERQSRNPEPQNPSIVEAATTLLSLIVSRLRAELAGDTR